MPYHLHNLTRAWPVGLLLLAACSPGPQLAVPDRFKEVSQKNRIKGVNGFMLNQKLSFGPYQTSRVKRGWTSTTENIHYTLEQRLLQVFSIDHFNSTTRQKNRYRYTITDGQESIQVFCQEKATREEIKLNTGTKLLGELAQTRRTEYAFTAGLLPEGSNETWQLLLHSVYDRSKDTARKLFSLPYKEEEGYASNGTETITIRPLRIKNMVTKKGKQMEFPVKILSGYELRIDDGVIAIIDSLDNNLWVYNELDAPTKRMAAAICSALLLRQLEDTNE